MTPRKPIQNLEKCPTGIRGLDEILQGGLPRGRPTLVCGGAGSGKTLMAMEFIVRGARDLGEPGVFMAFEETEEELAQNVASLGFDLKGLTRRKLVAMDYVRVERSEIEETGEYDLEGLFVRLDSMISRIGAKRVAIDSLEALFSALPNEAILRAELRRLFRWLKDKGVTAVITGEQGREHPDASRPRGVCQRLRDLPRPPGHQPGGDPPAAGGEIPRFGPRHERVPDHDRREGLECAPDQLARVGLPRDERARFERHRRA